MVLNVAGLVVAADNPDANGLDIANVCFLTWYTVELGLHVIAYRWSCVCPRRTFNAGLLDPVLPTETETWKRRKLDAVGNEYSAASSAEVGAWSRRKASAGVKNFADPVCPIGSVNWIRLDMAVVFVGWGDLFVNTVRRNAAPNTSCLMVVRALRMLQVLRVLRVFRALKPLTKLLHGLWGSCVSVLWIMAFMFVIMILYAIFTAKELGRHAMEYTEDAEDIEYKWGTVWHAFRTLFTFLTLDDWANMTRAVAWPGPNNPNPFAACILSLFMLISYVIVTAFVILALLTGTMAERMQRASQEDSEEDMLQMWKRLHKNVDGFYGQYSGFSRESRCGSIAGLLREDFVDLVRSCDFQGELRNAGLELEIEDRTQAESLFRDLDSDGNGVLNWDEFSTGLFHLMVCGQSQKQYNKLQAFMNYAARDAAFAELRQPASKAEETMTEAVDNKTDMVHGKIRCVEGQVLSVRKELDRILYFLQAEAPGL